MLNKIREFIADNPNAWKKAVNHAPFKKNYALSGESLKRPPRGFSADHPLIVDLKRKDFIAIMDFDVAEIGSPKFINMVARSFKKADPLMSYLCMAVDANY